MKSILFVITLLLSQSLHAGPFTDQLSRCLVKSTSEADKELLIKWIYAAMSSHPKVQHMGNVSVAEGAKLNKITADLMVELLAVRCKKETKEAYQYEGESIFEASFGVLGQVAMQGIMVDPNVSAYKAGLGESMDSSKLEKVFKK